MKRRARWALLAVTVLAVSVGLLGCCHSIVAAPYFRWRIGANMRSPSQFEGGHFAVNDGIPTLHVYGTPAEMGRQYGACLRPALRNLHHYMRCVLPSEMQEHLMTLAMEQEPFLPAEIREELRQMAEASGMPHEEIVALNVIVRPFCSALAVWGPETPTGRMIMGRNAEYFDFGLGDRGSMLVVYHPADGIPVAAISFLGMAGAYTGVNAKGVAFGNMLVFNARQDALDPEGMPIQLAMRQAGHRADSCRRMADLLIAVPRKIPINVMIADRSEAQTLELGTTGWAANKGEAGVLAISNYFADSSLASDNSAAICPRRNSLLWSAAGRVGRFNTADMETALHAARLVARDGREMNLQSVIFEPEAMRMHLSLNRIPASAGPFMTIDLTSLFAEPKGKE